MAESPRKQTVRFTTKRARGIGKKPSASKADFATEWAQHKAEERSLEDAKYGRGTKPRFR